MTYPGNASLSGAVKDRVISTFQQALTLYQQGRKDEVVAGCTLILQMDPMFDPAKKLLDKTRNPASPIDVNALLPADDRGPMPQAREAMAARDFQRVIQLTTDILTDDILNDDARVLGDEARERMEAAPFVEQFTRKCDQLIASGNLAAAKMELEKARALDPTHPDIIRVAQRLTSPDRPAAAASPSFIVDDKSAPPSGVGRTTAQAADFGFSFEEEKPPEVSFSNFSFDTPAQGFSFDAPSSAPASDSPFSGFSFNSPSTAPAAPPAAKAPVTGEFDFATASVATTPDDQKKIEQYLADGDRAFEAGDYQQAIDLWSRIFLIDVTNDQASERIERGKARRREIESKIETILSAGITAFERGDTAKAHAELSEVLRLDPNNTSAQEYLDRLGETAVEGGASARAETFIPPSVSDEKLDLGFFEEESSGGFETPLMPPDRPAIPSPQTASGKRAAPAGSAKAKATTERKLPVGAIATVLAVLVLGAGGWFAWSKFFNKPDVDYSATQSTLDRATQLAAKGKYDQAINLLKDIKPDDPLHDKALVLIADLNAKKGSARQMIDGIPAEQYFSQRLQTARTAYDAHDFSGAKIAFEEAIRVKPLPPDAKAIYDSAAQQVAKLDSAKALFAERKYSDAISNLQSLLDQDPQNKNIQRLIVDAHFNLGAQALQEEKTQDAIREFDEVLKVTPDDDLARRSRELAQRYDGETKDLLYRIYVKYLPLRQAT